VLSLRQHGLHKLRHRRVSRRVLVEAAVGADAVAERDVEIKMTHRQSRLNRSSTPTASGVCNRWQGSLNGIRSFWEGFDRQSNLRPPCLFTTSQASLARHLWSMPRRYSTEAGDRGLEFSVATFVKPGFTPPPTATCPQTGSRARSS